LRVFTSTVLLRGCGWIKVYGYWHSHRKHLHSAEAKQKNQDQFILKLLLPRNRCGRGADLIFDLMAEPPLRADLDGYWTCN